MAAAQVITRALKDIKASKLEKHPVLIINVPRDHEKVRRYRTIVVSPLLRQRQRHAQVHVGTALHEHARQVERVVLREGELQRGLALRGRHVDIPCSNKYRGQELTT